jgi:hypothetical protein
VFAERLEWTTCAEEGCIGAAVADGKCLAHLHDEEEPAALHRLIAEAQFSGDVSFAEAQFSGDASFAGAQFSGDVSFGGAQFAGGASFGGAQFAGDAIFAGAQFAGDVSFGGAQFAGGAIFAGAQFSDGASFAGAQFADDAYFAGAQFSGGANFHEAQFSGAAPFGGAQFAGDAREARLVEVGVAAFMRTQFADEAYFMTAEFSDDASFAGAQFSGDAYFDGAQFSGVPYFGRAQFSGAVSFHRAQFSGDARFEESVFRRRTTIGPIAVSGRLSLDGADFEQDLELNVSASEVSCRRTRFGGRADINVRWAEIALDDASFLQRSRLAGVAPFPGLDDTSAQLCRVDRRLDAQPQPRLLSLRQADIENLAIGNLDLRACRFAGAHGLDGLRIEADCLFAQPPRRRRYTRRRTLAEEHQWQADRRGARRHQRGGEDASGAQDGWHPAECQPSARLGPGPALRDPPRIAALYRALRKALEDRKDEPGAADFYYGEMEMRRHAKASGGGHDPLTRATSGAERLILTLYWAISGYGLRASRALGALLVVIAVFTAGFHLYGFQDRIRPYAAKTELQAAPRIPFPPSPGQVLAGWRSFEAWTYSAGTATAVIGAPEAQLTQAGRGMRIVLRILGPLLIGLALLSIRGRVKR